MEKNLPYYDLTMSIDGAVRVRDYAQTLVLRNKLTLDGLQRISDLQLFPHTMTHIDLLPRIEWDGLQLQGAIADLPEKPRDSGKLLENRILSCTVLSLEALAATMRGACERAWESGSPTHPSEAWEPEVFGQLLKKLRITRSALSLSAIRPRSFVLFYTGWRQFAPSDGDLTHSGWYPWHPYLMNPYLDEEAVEYLVGSDPYLDATGIGCDIGTLDSPLRYLSGYPQESPLDESRGPVDIWQYAEDQDYIPSVNLPPSARFRPVHIHTLARTKLLVEQLHIPSAVTARMNRGQSAGYPATHGTVLLLPYRCSRSVDAVLASAIFIPEEVEDATHE